MLARLMRHVPGGIMLMVMPFPVILLMLMITILLSCMMRVRMMKVRLCREMYRDEIQVKRGQHHCGPAARASQ